VCGRSSARSPRATRAAAPRVENIHRIADIVDGYVLRPGDQFDLNGYVGPRDKARGFQEAPQILEGQFVDRVGGGVSQFATTIFNAVFFSGLKDVTHTPHSYYISRYPPGREATVSFPLPDLIFENDSPHGVLIKTSYTSTSITVTFWGTKRFDEVKSITGARTRIRDFGTEYVDRDDCTATDGAEGFDIVVTRVFVDGGREVRREDFKTRYKPEPRFICGKAPRRR
jgi:vancomycin resistance protein YoaR